MVFFTGQHHWLLFAGDERGWTGMKRDKKQEKNFGQGPPGTKRNLFFVSRRYMKNSLHLATANPAPA